MSYGTYRMIFNTTSKKLISQKERYCRNIFSQSFGLMFRKKQNLIMEFPRERRVSLHMWFVFFPIDVLVVDKSLEIVEIKRNFKPWTFWKSKNKGKYIIELAFQSEYKEKDKIKI